MEATHDVIVDLLPVYFSGDASAATRALVDDFLARDPVFAERVRREWHEPLAGGASTTAARPDVEVRSLQRTRRLLTALRWLFGLGLAFSLLPLSMEMSFSNGRVTEFHFLIRDQPWLLGPMLTAGVACWIAYFALKRQVRIK
jgi:hypothetical protein